MTFNDSEQLEIHARIVHGLETFGAEALNSKAADEAAREWLDMGFDDAEEIADWLRARCFAPADARRLEDAGLTPDQAAFLTRAGSNDYEDTLAYKFAHNDLSLEEARRIITNEFWNK